MDAMKIAKTMMIGVDPALPQGERMVFAVLKSRTGHPPVLISDLHIGNIPRVPEGCLDVWEETDGL